jgi:hypothetical protein
MLVFQDREGAAPQNAPSINGNASTTLNGILYFPKSEVRINGSANVTSQCLMIAAARITIFGNTNMSSFCPSGQSNDVVVANTIGGVRLVG